MTNCRLQLECASRREHFPTSSLAASSVADSRIRVAVRSARGPAGPVGPQGLRGPPGPPGPKGDCARESNKSASSSAKDDRDRKLKLFPVARKQRIRQRDTAEALPGRQEVGEAVFEAGMSKLGGLLVTDTYTRRKRSNDDTAEYILKEFFIPKSRPFSDRLVTIESFMGRCSLQLPQTKLGSLDTNSQETLKCASEPIELLSPFDGIVIDWDHLEGVSTEQLWMYFETALNNETFSQAIEDPAPASSSIHSIVSWRRLVADPRVSTSKPETRTADRYLQRGSKRTWTRKADSRVPGGAAVKITLSIHLLIFIVISMQPIR
ncbi:unnamed protein product [Dicrocoelium dendriticum]|nr:unnamed protein product [Dicrocoelium dendriticum]